MCAWRAPRAHAHRRRAAEGRILRRSTALALAVALLIDVVPRQGAHTVMIWFMERESDVLICEIRRADGAASYEFEVAPRTGLPETQRFDSATELINQYLRTQTTLLTEGWRPRMGAIGVVG